MPTKAPILLYCPERELLGTLAFALRLHPYDVLPADSGIVVSRLCARRPATLACGVLVHAQQGDLAGRLMHRLLESGLNIPLLLVDRIGDLAPVRYADIVLYGRNTSTAHILGALKVLCARRRGPRSAS